MNKKKLVVTDAINCLHPSERDLNKGKVRRVREGQRLQSGNSVTPRYQGFLFHIVSCMYFIDVVERKAARICILIVDIYIVLLALRMEK